MRCDTCNTHMKKGKPYTMRSGDFVDYHCKVCNLTRSILTKRNITTVI